MPEKEQEQGLIITDSEGKQWRVERYRIPKKGQHFVSWTIQTVEQLLTDCGPDEFRLIVEPIREERVFGGIWFAKVHDGRQVHPDEWYQPWGDRPYLMLRLDSPTKNHFPVWEPISLEKKEENDG